MNATYLYLYPSVILSQDNNCHLLYNTDTHKQLQFDRVAFNDKLFKLLSCRKNLYSVKINKEDSYNKTIRDIVNQKFGLLIDAQKDAKPVALLPECVIRKNAHEFRNQDDYFNPNILEYIRRIIIHLDGYCKYNCAFCGSYYRQVRHCTKTNSALSAIQLNKIVRIINQINLSTVELIWQQSSLPFLSNIAAMFKDVRCLKIYHFNISFIGQTELNIIKDIDSSVLIKIIVDVELFEDYTSLMTKINDYCESFNSYIFVFICSSDRDIRLVIQCIETSVKYYEIRCVYGGDSFSFLNKHFFLNDSDLQHLSIDLRSFFAHQHFNTELFGTIVIDSNTYLHFDENSSTIGRVEESWYEIINNEFYRKDNPWLWIRDNHPCNRCAYQFLCPPVTSLEKYSGHQCVCSDYYRSLK